MTTSTWSKLALLSVGLVLMGQSCSINIGGTTRLDGGIFRSDDHGQTWQQKNYVGTNKNGQVNIGNVTTRTLNFIPSASGTIYIGTLANGIWSTTNSGDTWKSTSIRAGDYECLAFDPLNSQVMYTTAGQIILKSIDGGQSWSTVYTEPQPGQAVNCVQVSPANGNIIWATTSGGKIILSTDYGLHWTLIHTLAAIQPRLLYIPPEAPDQLYIFTRTNGIFHSLRLGQEWVDMTPALQTFAGATDIRQIDITPHGWYLATAYGLLASTDHGGTWASIHNLVTNGSVAIQTVAVNPNNASEIFITSGQQIQHTTNGGQNWSVVSLPTSRLPVLLTFDPNVKDRLYFATFTAKK